jgi:hypothetical protein
VGKNPARSAAGPAKDGRGVVLGYSWPDSNRMGGAVVPWRSRAATAAVASRGMPGFGELPAGARERTAGSALVEARGGPGTVARPRKLVVTRLGGGGHGGRWPSKEQWGGAHTAGKARGLGFKDRQPMLCDVPPRPEADWGSSAVRRRDIVGRVGSASRYAHRGATRGGHGLLWHPRVRARLRKALHLGRRAGGSDAEGGRHPTAWRARGRTRRVGRCDVAAHDN